MNSARQKQIILWGFILIIVAILAGAGMMFLNRNNTSEEIQSGGFFSFLFGGEGGGVLGSLFGGGEENGTQGGTTPSDGTQPAIDLISQVFPEPVSGATFVTLSEIQEETEGAEDVLAIRVITKATGHIFDIPVDTLEATRITNTTIPHIHDALFSADGSQLFTRSLNDTDVVEGTGISISTAEEEGEVIGVAQAEFLRTGTLTFDTNPSQDSLFLLERTQSGSRGIIVPFSGEGPKETFSSPLSEWLIDWAEDDYIYLTTKPSASVPGYSYYTSLSSSTLNPLLSGINGLTTLVNPDGTKVLFSESLGNTLILKVFSDGEETALLFDTLPEKCVWDTAGEGVYCGVPFSLPFIQYPDTWYKGEMFFEDDIWYYDVEESTGFFLVDPNMYDATIDLINPILSDDGSLLLFTNKRDMTPWILRIDEAMENVNY